VRKHECRDQARRHREVAQRERGGLLGDYQGKDQQYGRRCGHEQGELRVAAGTHRV